MFLVCRTLPRLLTLLLAPVLTPGSFYDSGPQVIIERMDRLKPGIHLTLKVASVMGQWVDLDILHKFYPITKSKEELRAHLKELERGAQSIALS